jgi:CSLREA domain-containing protein
VAALRNLLLAVAALGVGAGAAQAATIPVTTTADVIANDGRCSLREAVFAARFDGSTPSTLNCVAGSPGEDVIQLEAGTYALAAGGADEDANEAGDLDTGPTSALRVVGRGTTATVIAAAGNRAFDVFPGASLGLSDLTIRDAAAPHGGSGGAVRNKGALTVLRVAFINDAAGDGAPQTSFGGEPAEDGGGGGAIQSEGQLQVSDALFSATRAGDGAPGGHFVNPANPNNTIDSGPRRGGSGGAILITGGSAAIANSTFVGSRAGDGKDRPPDVSYAPGGSGGHGGAIAVTGGSATVVNSTFTGNRAGNAGAPRFGYADAESVPGSGGAAAAVSPGTLAITFSTFAGNAVGAGPSGTAGAGAAVSGAAVSASVLADPAACATLAPAAGANVTVPGDTSCPGARIPGDARLGALADNGGATPTLLPGAGSAAINALSGVPCPGTDQRGLPRPALGACDAGAVEIQPGTPQAVGAPGPGGAAARSITKLAIGPAAFRAAGRKPLGTTVTFRLSAAGKVVLTVTKPAAGKRSGKRCVAPTRKLRGARRCIRQVTLPGTVTKNGAAGLNVLRFSGRLRGRALPPGRYTLVLTLPKAGASPAVSATKGFRILG